ncbi:MAG: hypothetical protein FWC73_05920 [Defluviitaleaceae bacterium]|nr:hypothetical protein [Defluviitaleaceae bacterium]
MSETKNQKNKKPTPEEIATDFLEGQRLKDCLMFIEFLRSNNLPPRWIATNAWEVKPHKYKILGQLTSQILRRLRINKEEKSWSVSFHYYSQYNEYVADDGMRQLITRSLYVKRRFCHGEGCRATVDLNVFGKIFNKMCCNEQIMIVNPSGEDLEHTKNLLLLTKEIVEKLISPPIL